ncbi:Lar family restriction alleviation protein [Trinickia dinghuensis]|uniref:Restriction alleviation protein, Lar family n=1 Tax=Trinickia dinghuensis TaxID=2291023 RepID=A0A3D8K1T3_9BURK|nr:Lar family restriction alleviation protein [Trinickia dinghuensis]RDU99209.1 hypothetical protein DWV00_08775 [Trinickia dinghuensis]
MKTEISANGVSFVGFGSHTHELGPCKFCGAAAGEIDEDQIEANSWVAWIHCSECDVSVTLQYTSPSPEEAIAEVVRMWNREPE